jgi:hypothetical protein
MELFILHLPNPRSYTSTLYTRLEIDLKTGFDPATMPAAKKTTAKVKPGQSSVSQEVSLRLLRVS